MFKFILGSWIVLSCAAHANAEVAFVKTAPGCPSKGIVEGTFGKELYEKWSVWEPVHFDVPSAAMDSMAKKAASLGGNRIVITEIRPIYLATKTWTHGDYAPHTTTSFSTVTIQGAVYACN